MRKIISAILCVVFSALLLVGCGEDVIGEYLDKYEKPEEKQKITINLYVICEDNTDKNSTCRRLTAGKHSGTTTKTYQKSRAYQNSETAEKLFQREFRRGVFHDCT